MHRPPRRVSRPFRLLLGLGTSALLVAASGALLGGCDNPACIFSGNCNSDDGDGGNGGPTDPTASGVVFPVDGEWIVDGAPAIDEVFPNQSANSTTPIVLLFSESMNPASVSGAFNLVADTEGASPVTLSASLTGDGRFLLLRPMGALTPGTGYDIRFTSSAVVRDLTGVAVVKPVSNLVGSFSVATQPPNAPQLVASWPLDGATNQSAVGQVVVAFDRPMNAESVDSDSFVVTVDGNALMPETSAEVYRPNGGAPESRVYVWRHVDGDGVPIPLPAGGQVRVELSPSGSPITDVAGTALANTVIEFDVAPFSLPVSAEILTDPDDAIGIEHLVGAMPLMVEVQLAEPAQAGDVLGIDLFGIGPTSGLNAFLPRTFPLPEGATEVVLGPQDLQLVSVPDPLQAVFADGEVGFSFRVRRGGATSPVRLMDVDAAAAGIQDPLLDTTAPDFVAFGSTGEVTNQFRADLYDLAVIGRSSEPLRSVEVAATVEVGGKPMTVTNGQLPPLPGNGPEGLFVAAPISGDSFAGLEGMPVQLAVRLYDRALNSSGDVTASYVRRGVVGGGNVINDTVTMRVYDSVTIEGVAGALVFVHALSGGGSGTPVTIVHAAGPFVTDQDGRVALSIAYQGELIFTVDALDYDLFSIQTTRTRLLDAPLVATPRATALLRTAITSADPELEMLEHVGADSRRPVIGLDPLLEMSCTTDPFTEAITCITLPDAEEPGYLLAADRPGVFTYFAIDRATAPQLFSAEDFLQGFVFLYPRPSLEPSEMALSVTAPLGALLADLGDPEEEAIAAPPVQLDASDVVGLRSAPLPEVRIEAVSPGLPDPSIVGMGQSFDLDGNLVWDVLSAYPGAVDPIAVGNDALGRLVADRAVGDELYLAMELVDEEGNRSALRRVIAATPPAQPLVPPDVPEVLSPATGTGGTSFDVIVPSVLPDGTPAMYSATVSEFFAQTGVGRSWRLWRVRPAGEGGTVVRLRVPDIAALGGTPLFASSLTVSADVSSHDGLVPTEFAWSELALRAQRSAASAPRLITNP